MNRILLLTENIYIETEFQRRLQKLNYEVFLSTSLVDTWRRNPNSMPSLSIFQLVIISETIANVDAEALAAYFKEKPVALIRKADVAPSKQMETSWQETGFVGWLSNDLSMEELREKMFQYRDEVPGGTENQEQVSSKVAIANLNLSVMQKQLLEMLLARKGEIISRQEIGQELWHEEPNASNLSQISYKIGQIKQKIEQTYGIFVSDYY